MQLGLVNGRDDAGRDDRGRAAPCWLDTWGDAVSVLAHPFRPLAGSCQFGHHVQLVAGHVGIGNRSPGLPFIAVGRRGVDMPVTGAQRRTCRPFGVCRRDLENSEPDGGYRLTVVQRDQGTEQRISDDKESARRAGSQSRS
jgi:hypothetical protein